MTATVRTPTYPKSKQTNVRHVVWSGLDGDDTGRPVRVSKFNDKSVHIYAETSHGGATTIMQGTNDERGNPDHASHSSAKWVGLTDAQGNAISKTSDAIEQILENPMWIRPSQSGGTGADVVVALTCKRTP